MAVSPPRERRGATSAAATNAPTPDPLRVRRESALAVHGHGGDGATRSRLAIALAITAAALALELWGAVWTGSLALLADAGHMLSDMAALALALLAAWMAGRAHTRRATFGFHRAEVLAATANASGVLLIAALVVWRAVERLRDPAEVDGARLAAIATLGLAANLVALLVLREGASVNLRAARLHVLADLGGSVAAVAAGLLVALTGWERADAVLSLAIVALIAVTAGRLLRETLAVLMEQAPAGVALRDIEEELAALPGVRRAHDLHCWTIAGSFISFACHLELEAETDPLAAIEAATALLHDRHGIHHVTIQPEGPAAVPLLDAPSEPTAVSADGAGDAASRRGAG